MASRGVGRHLLLTGAAVAVIGALVADVALGEHPTHSVVLAAVGIVMAMLRQRLARDLVAGVPALAAALAVQPVLHLTSEASRPPGPAHHHANLLLHMVVDEAATAVVQIAIPALVLVAVTICAHLARLLVDAVGAPPALPHPPWVAVRSVRGRTRPLQLGSLLHQCGWVILAARRGPPVRPAHVMH